MRPTPVLAVTAAAVLVGALVPASPARAASAGDLHGTVSAGGAVSAPVTVGWYQPDTGGEGTVRSGSDGTFALPLPAAGARFIVFAGLRHASDEPSPELPHLLGAYYGTNGRAFEFQSRTRFTAGAALPASLAVDLAPATPLTGTLPAIAKRTVYLLNRNDDEVGEQKADAAGSFRFEVVPGAYRVEIDRDRTHLDYRSPVFTVHDGAPSVLQVTQRIGAVVSGVVRSGGKPVGGVEVSTGGAGVGSTTTKADGTYRLTGLTPGTHSIRFSRVGTADAHSVYVPAAHTVTGLTLGRTVRVDAALQRGARITGAFAAGDDADRYTVLLTPRTGGRTTGYGRAAHPSSVKNPVYFSGLKPGSYLLRAFAAQGAEYARKTITVTAGATVRLGTLHPTVRTLTLSGSVGTGSGVVLAYDRNGMAGGYAVVSAGHYSLSGLIPGTYSVYSSAGSRIPATTTVRLTTSLHRGLPVGTRPGTLKGRVQVGGVDLLEGSILADADTGATANPLAPFFGELDSDITKGVLTGSGAAGRHTIAGLDFWTRPFQANSPYFLTWPAGWVTLQAGTTTNIGTVQLGLQG